MGIVEKIVESIKDIEGWLTPDEATLLAHTAINRLVGYDLLAGESWVEIGSYCGKSTCLLGQIIKQHVPPDAAPLLYAIDPHEGKLTYPASFDDQGRFVPRDTNSQEKPTLSRFFDNLSRFNLHAGVVVPIIQSSTLTDPRWFNPPIDLIFIDGLHDYASVKADYEHFKPYLAPGAIVAWHDDNWEGVHKCITERVNAGEITIIAQADSLVISKYIKEQ